MLRLRQSASIGADPQQQQHHNISSGNGPASPLVPLGGDVSASTQYNTPSKNTPRRRRKKASPSCFRSCLIALRIVGDPRESKTIESLSNKSRSSPSHRGGGRIVDQMSCCITISSLICFIMVTLGLYNIAVKTDNRNLVIRATTNISPELMASLADYRPPSFELEEENKELPILLFSNHKPHHKKHHRDSDEDEEEDEGFYYPDELGRKQEREAMYLDFGGIDIKLLPDDDQKRQIYIMVEDRHGSARSLDQPRDDDYDEYWNFDDDILRNPYRDYNEFNPSMDGRCRRVSWHRYNLQNCNNLHEMDLVTNTPRFVGDGAYREVFVTELPNMDSIEELIFKEIRWDLDQKYDDFEYVRMDAFVTERLTSNKHTVDIYGYCGLSMLTEYFAWGDIEDDVVGYQKRKKKFNPVAADELQIYNNFTSIEKLRLALAMVKPVEALHNFKDGVIVHDDIQLCQYLWTDESKKDVKLNDFNRAEIMLWDEQAQRYCKYKNGAGHGDWRAPEEYKDLPLDEKIDIWSLGNNFFSLLTGYYPFSNVEEDKKIVQKIVKGETAVIDPRFVNDFGLGKLVEVIERCFVYSPDKRADINEIKQMLEQAIADTEQYEKEEAVRLTEEEKRRKEQLKQRFEREKESMAKDILAKSKAQSAGAIGQNADPESIDHNGGEEAKAAVVAKDPVP